LATSSRIVISGASFTSFRSASSMTSFCGSCCMTKSTRPWNPTAYPFTPTWSIRVLTFDDPE